MSEIESPKKRAFYVGIPRGLRFSLIWTIFFAVVGLFIEYSKLGASFIWTNFFTSSYFQWFSSFGHFTDSTVYPDLQSIVLSILGSWYYFFYTGGLLALIWEVISWIVHFEVRPKEKNDYNYSLEQEELMVREPGKQEEIKENKLLFLRKVDRGDIEDWLDEAWLLISEGKVQEAEALYNQIRRYYSPSKDPEKFLHASIMDLYLALVECKK
jgi:hypothetical protein